MQYHKNYYGLYNLWDVTNLKYIYILSFEDGQYDRNM